MKLSRRQLRKIINEEYKRLIKKSNLTESSRGLSAAMASSLAFFTMIGVKDFMPTGSTKPSDALATIKSRGHNAFDIPEKVVHLKKTQALIDMLEGAPSLSSKYQVHGNKVTFSNHDLFQDILNGYITEEDFNKTFTAQLNSPLKASDELGIARDTNTRTYMEY